MKKVLGIISFCVCLAMLQISCSETPQPQAEKTSTEKKCCAKGDSAKCDHHSMSDSTVAHACKPGCKKSCCTNMAAKGCCSMDSSKTCAGDSATCAAMKTKCNTECGTDSTMCASHVTECKAKCAAKMDSTQTNHCLPTCDQPCCSGDKKEACGPSCEKDCCTKM